MADQSKKEINQAESQPDPWDSVYAAQSSFLNDLDCISEMGILVLPVLKNRDEERTRRIDQLSSEAATEESDKLAFKSLDDLKEFVGHIGKVRRAERLFRQGVITSVVSKFDEFFIEALKVSYKHNPGWLKNNDKKITYKELLEIESLDAIKDEIVAKEIDNLMRDSHLVQITYLDSRLKLGVEREFPGWLAFLEITERRNLFVHTGGVISPQYMENCKKWKLPGSEKLIEGKHLSASDKYIQSAIDCFYELSVRVAQATVRRLFPASFEESDRALNNRSVDLLIEGRFELAEKVFEYALSIPEDLTSKGEMKYYFLLNQCLARKFGGKSFDKQLHSVDWSPFHPKYHFAVAVLEDRFEDADRLMRSQAVHSEITEEHMKQWPLLRDFRKTEIFQKAFKDIFGKDLDQELREDVQKEILSQKDENQSLQCTTS